VAAKEVDAAVEAKAEDVAKENNQSAAGQIAADAAITSPFAHIPAHIKLWSIMKPV